MARPTLGDGETVRLHVMIEDDELAAIDAWQFANRVPTRSEAVRRLCKAAIQKGPAETAISPSHGPNNPHQEKAMDVRSDTTAQAEPTRDVWFRRACEYESALRNVEIIASAANTILVQEGSASSLRPDMFDVPRRAFDEGTAFLRAIEDICARAREAE